MTAQQLKNSILQMAVQGKLVSQDPNDEPASVLIQKIRGEKEQMIKDGKIKKEKNPSFVFRGVDGLFYEKIGDKEPVCIEDEMPFEIPDSWEWERLKNISILTGGYAFKSSEYVENGIRVIRISDFDENGLINKDCKFYPENEALLNYLLHDYDILLCMTGGTVGKSCYLNELQEKMYLNQRVADIRSISKSILQEYIYWALNSPYIVKVIHSAKTSTNDNISMVTIGNLFIPIPPVCEQQRILKKINETLPIVSKYDVVEQRRNQLNIRFPKNLKDSVLQIAVQGKLVPQDPNDEPASVLIKKIHYEKEQLIKDGKIKRDKHESIIYKRDGSYYEKVDGKEKCIDDEIPFEIPDSWEWARLSSVCETIFDIDHKMPKTVSKNGVLFLSAKDLLDDGGINYDNQVKYISEEDFKRLSSRKGIPQKGDILYSRIGSLGKARIIDRDVRLLASYSCCTIRPLYIDTDFLQILLDGGFVLQQAKSKTQSIGVPDLGMQMIKTFFIPIPPLNEQKRISKKLKNIFDLL